LVRGTDRALEHHAGANENAFVFGAFAHGRIFQKMTMLGSLYCYCQFKQINTLFGVCFCHHSIFWKQSL
jgi:hypothetical protein